MYGNGHNAPPLGPAGSYASECFSSQYWPAPAMSDDVVNAAAAPHSYPSGHPIFPPPPLAIPDRLAYGGDLDSVCEGTFVSGNHVSSCATTTGSSSTATTGYSSYGSPSCGTPTTATATATAAGASAQPLRPSLMQRSVSSHSLHKNELRHRIWSPTEFLDSEDGPVRRVFSTGDLQGINVVQQSPQLGSPLSNEAMIIEGMSRATRYSPEEKKERIERYRSKRNQRNFNKKIKYACRKTLADSRPRIRGRFARNEDQALEKSPQMSHAHDLWGHVISGEDDDEDDENWINILQGLPANLIP